MPQPRVRQAIVPMPAPDVPRDELGRFPKGVSGYPGGPWAKGSVSEALKRRIENGDGEKIADRLLLTATGENAKARTADEIKAAEVIADRVEGKALQRTQSVSIQVSPEVMERLTKIAEKLAALPPSSAQEI